MKKYKDYITEITMGKVGAFANTAHSNQFRKQSGASYIVHPTAVVRILQKMGVKDKNILSAGYLHDTVEDTEVTYNNIRDEFNKEIADIVKEVTSNNKEMKKLGKPKYLAVKMINMSNAALLVKLADRLHNISDNVSKQYLEQTLFILNELKNGRSMNRFHKKIIKKINRILYKKIKYNNQKGV